MKDVLLSLSFGFCLIVPVFLCLFIMFIFLYIFLKITENIRGRGIKKEELRWKEAALCAFFVSGGIINWLYHSILDSVHRRFLADFGNGVFCIMMALALSFFVVNILFLSGQLVFTGRRKTSRGVQPLLLPLTYYFGLCLYGTFSFASPNLSVFA